MTGGLWTNVLIHRALYTQYKGKEPPSIYDNEKDRKRLGHRASCPQESASDSDPGLVLGRSGLAKVTDRILVTRIPGIVNGPEWHLPHEVEDALAILVGGTNPTTVR
ncbi:hypothetical protein PIB30_100198 [Stylosanthes scabra]|uniref:Uncharacterized protein n=1 Tax=Stylosanthes scabra TaxID=79078 RepID=A0ABU6TZ25_9FABA|nr:hypothetical protein [Stylosanthes scabra]